MAVWQRLLSTHSTLRFRINSNKIILIASGLRRNCCDVFLICLFPTVSRRTCFFWTLPALKKSNPLVMSPKHQTPSNFRSMNCKLWCMNIAWKKILVKLFYQSRVGTKKHRVTVCASSSTTKSVKKTANCWWRRWKSA